MDDTIRALIRFVSRGFYSKSDVLIMDAVLLHSVLSEDDLIYLLSIPRKELRAFCNRLVEDRLLAAQIQKEENPGLRLTTRTYYYIRITEAIDAIKWKVHSVVNTIKDEMTHYGNPQGYVCPRCGKKVSQLDAISLLSDDKLNFVCDNCSGILVEDDSSQQATIRQANLEKLMVQIDPVIAFLKKIDDAYIEDNNFETALTKAIPAQSSTISSYTIAGRMPGRSRSNMSSSLQNAASKSQATLHVSITANDENYEREQTEKESRRQKLEQNALPSWHSASTVGKSILGRLDDDDAGAAGSIKAEGTSIVAEHGQSDASNKTSSATPIPAVKSEASASPEQVAPTSEAELKDREAQDVLAAYYADLAEREAAEDEDEDDDFDDFEDV